MDLEVKPVTTAPINQTVIGKIPEPVKTVEAPKEVKPEEDKLTPRFAELSKKDAEVRRKEKELKDLEKKLNGYTDFSKSPKKALQEKNITLEQFIQGYLAEDTGKEVTSSADQKLAEVQAKLDKLQKDREQETSRTQEMQKAEAVKNYKANLKTQVSTSTLAGIKVFQDQPVNNSVDMIYDVQDSYYQQHGKELSFEQAATDVEKYLRNSYELLHKAYVVEEKTKSPTLTNHMAPSGVKTDLPYLPRDESIAELAKQLKEKRLHREHK